MNNYRDNIHLTKMIAVCAVCLTVSTLSAAPKNTLPPGFYTTPLSQPKIEPPAEKKIKTKKNAEEVPTAPTSPSDVAQSFLPLLENDLLVPPLTGLIYGAAGLGDGFWLEGDGDAINQLLSDWKVNIRSRPVAELARRFLLTQVQTPAGIDGYDFIRVRLEKLYALGDLRAVKDFFDLYPVLASRKDFLLLYQQMTFARHANRRKGISEGCALWTSYAQIEKATTPISPEALQIETLCEIITSQSDPALARKKLSEARVLVESAQISREFYQLLAMVLNPSITPPAPTTDTAPRSINNLLWALYKTTGKKPRATTIKNIEPVLLPFMAQDRTLSYGWRLAAAQQAVLRGIVSPRFLQAFYISGGFRKKKDAVFTPPLPRNPSRQANRAQVVKISNIFANAPTRTAYMASLYSWARDIAFLDPQSGHRRVDGLRAALLLNAQSRIQVWLGAQPPSELPPAMRAMLLILKDAKRSVHRGISPQAVKRWQINTDQIVKIIGAEFFDLSDSSLPDADEGEIGEALLSASERNARAEVVLHILVGMDNPALARSPAFLRAVIKGLSQIGLKQEAWQIAVDSFLLEAWGA